MATVTLNELAALVGGDLVGDGQVQVTGAMALKDAGPEHVTFVADAKHDDAFLTGPAAAAIVHADFPAGDKPVIRVGDPLGAFIAVCIHFRGPRARARIGVHAQSVVADSAELGADVNVYRLATVGDETSIGDRTDVMVGVYVGARCRIGRDVLIHPNVTILDDTVIGDRVIIHSGAVIGADGFGYRFREGRHVKIPQLGYVDIGDDVEIGANTTIDRATFGVTRIGAGTKIDNLVTVAHNSELGEHCVLAGQTGIAGSATLGRYVVTAGQAGVGDHVTVGDGAILGAQTGAIKNVAAGARVFWTPARPLNEIGRILALLFRLPKLRAELKQLAAHVAELDKRLGSPDDKGD